jgi:hypothetical protein
LFVGAGGGAGTGGGVLLATGGGGALLSPMSAGVVTATAPAFAPDVARALNGCDECNGQ